MQSATSTVARLADLPMSVRLDVCKCLETSVARMIGETAHFVHADSCRCLRERAIYHVEALCSSTDLVVSACSDYACGRMSAFNFASSTLFGGDHKLIAAAGVFKAPCAADRAAIAEAAVVWWRRCPSEERSRVHMWKLPQAAVLFSRLLAEAGSEVNVLVRSLEDYLWTKAEQIRGVIDAGAGSSGVPFLPPEPLLASGLHLALLRFIVGSVAERTLHANGLQAALAQTLERGHSELENSDLVDAIHSLFFTEARRFERLLTSLPGAACDAASSVARLVSACGAVELWQGGRAAELALGFLCEDLLPTTASLLLLYGMVARTAASDGVRALASAGCLDALCLQELCLMRGGSAAVRAEIAILDGAADLLSELRRLRETLALAVAHLLCCEHALLQWRFCPGYTSPIVF